MSGDRPVSWFPTPRSRSLLFYLVVALAVLSLIVLTQRGSWSLSSKHTLHSGEPQKLREMVEHLEDMWKDEYHNYFGPVGDRLSTLGTGEIVTLLDQMSQETGNNTALIYLHTAPEALDSVLVTPKGNINHHLIPEASAAHLTETVNEFRRTITHPRYLRTTRYQPSGKQLYDWIITPLKKQLEAEDIDTLLLCVGKGLRSLPFGALFDGQQFLVEQYSTAIIPAFNLMTTVPGNPKKLQVLAMGASEFENLNPLPAVPLELELLSEPRPHLKTPWESQAFLNEGFTLENLKNQLRQNDFNIVHLATHAEFQPGEPTESYIQLWDTRLTLDQIDELPLNDPPLDLLVLSACRTAVGDPQAELGFAGLAFKSGVQSALASLWYVSDAGTLALMSEFYEYLPRVSIKAEALRQAQLALLRGNVHLKNRQLQGSRGAVDLPPSLENLVIDNLASPFYWAAFTLVGSPW